MVNSEGLYYLLIRKIDFTYFEGEWYSNLLIDIRTHFTRSYNWFVMGEIQKYREIENLLLIMNERVAQAFSCNKECGKVQIGILWGREFRFFYIDVKGGM